MTETVELDQPEERTCHATLLQIISNKGKEYALLQLNQPVDVSYDNGRTYRIRKILRSKEKLESYKNGSDTQYIIPESLVISALDAELTRRARKSLRQSSLEDEIATKFLESNSK